MRFILLVLIFGFSSFALADSKLAAHLLTYLSQDYGFAVNDGKIISESEYTEQVEFINEVLSISNKEGFPPDLASEVKHLHKLIMSKAQFSEVTKTSLKAKEMVIRYYKIPTVPLKTPDLNLGAKLFKTSCVQCHGDTGRGDGPDGKGLDPAPANFHDLERMASVSPFQTYTTITLGVPGTGMLSFNQLSEHERWSLAGYVMAFQYEGIKPSEAKFQIPFDDLWSLSDQELTEKYLQEIPNSKAILKELRTHLESNSEVYLDIAITKINESFENYSLGNFDLSKKLAFQSYLEGLEPIEPLIAQSQIPELERLYFDYRSLLIKGSDVEKVERTYHLLLGELEKVRETVNQDTTFTESAMIAFGIVFREALEACLVIILLLSVLKNMGASHAIKWVHAGWLIALGIGAALFLVLNAVNIDGSTVENLEGYVGLGAVFMLIYVGLWLHGNSNIKKWKDYIKTQVTNHLVNKFMLGLSLISFTAVFREVVETILFIKILQINKHSSEAISLGVLLSFVAVFVIFFVMIKLSVRIHIGKLMKASTILILAVSVSILGKSIHALQLTGMVSAHKIFDFSLPIVGLYGTWESFGAQVLLSLALVFFYKRQGKKGA